MLPSTFGDGARMETSDADTALRAMPLVHARRVLDHLTAAAPTHGFGFRGELTPAAQILPPPQAVPLRRRSDLGATRWAGAVEYDGSPQNARRGASASEPRI
jgi:hypothetical protein